MIDRAPSLQERILGLLREQDGMSVEDLVHSLPGYDRIDVDPAMTVLLRQAKVTLHRGRYSITDYGRKNPRAEEPRRSVAVASTSLSSTPAATRAVTAAAPPTAAQEAAQTLNGELRTCKGKCKKSKLLQTQFYKNKGSPGGYDTTCKDCRNERAKELAQTAQARAGDFKATERAPEARGHDGRLTSTKVEEDRVLSILQACGHVAGPSSKTATATQSGPEPGSQEAARHAPVGGHDREEAAEAAHSANTIADDSAERRGGRGDDTAEPTPRSAEPEKGDRKPSEAALGKSAPAQPTTVESLFTTGQWSPGAPVVALCSAQPGDARGNALARKVAITARAMALVAEHEALLEELHEVDRFLSLYDKFAGAAKEGS